MRVNPVACEERPAAPKRLGYLKGRNSGHVASARSALKRPVPGFASDFTRLQLEADTGERPVLAADSTGRCNTLALPRRRRSVADEAATSYLLLGQPEGADVGALEGRRNVSTYSQAKLNAVARRLNERPRKTLDFRTPAEMFNQAVALTG